MPVPSEPFAAVYEDRNRLGVIVARTGRGGFEAYAADDHSLGLFPTPRAAAAAITMARALGLSERALIRPRAEVSRPICKAPEAGRLYVTRCAR
jgi:hypothetical protein